MFPGVTGFNEAKLLLWPSSRALIHAEHKLFISLLKLIYDGGGGYGEGVDIHM